MIRNLQRQIPIAVLGLLILFSFAVKLYYIDKFPVYEDEAISVLSAEGIVQHGAPLLPSGLLYPRDLLHQYLLALPMAVFGNGEASIRFFSVLFSLVTIFGVYLLVSRQVGPWGGVLAAGTLVFSALEMYYALSARMYSQYQMFTVLAVYGFIRGFIQQERRYRWFCILSVTGMLLSHQLGLFVLGVMGIYLFVQHRWSLFRDPLIWKSLLLIAPAVYLAHFYKFPNAVVSVTGHSWRTKPFYALTQFNYEALTLYATHLYSGSFPWSLPIFFLGLGWTVWKRDRVVTFIYLTVLVPTVIMTFFDYKHPNYLFNLFAVYVGVVCIVLVSFWKEVRQRAGRIPAWGFHAAGVFLLLGYAAMMILQDRGAYGFESSRLDERPAHLFVKERMRPGDAVITSNPWVTRYYLGDFDFFIRQKFYQERGWGAFPIERDEYYNKVVVDTLPELEALMRNPDYHRLWIIVDPKFFGATGKEMIDQVGKNFRLVYGKAQRSRVSVGLYDRRLSP